MRFPGVHARFSGALVAATLLAAQALLKPVLAQETNLPVELSLKKFQVAPGLKVALFAAEPLLQNPVSFSIDEQGRIFVAETHRWRDSIFDITRKPSWLNQDLAFRTVEDRTAFLSRTYSTNASLLTKDSELIRLVEDRDGDGRADASSVFADGFNEISSGTAAGILARRGQVWFTSVPDLWRLSFSPGRTNALARVKMHSGFGVHVGVSGHDLHGLRLGPDGRIYFSSGDRGFNVEDHGRRLSSPDTGAVLRCNPDGTELEIFATGLRNPQELAFDDLGNLWTDDNDTAGEDTSRVLHIVEGGDYGWRCSYQHMSGYGPWVKENVWLGRIDGLLPPAGEGAQGPSGLAFYPGTGLSPAFLRRFLVCDFPGGVWSFGTQPRGASYEVTSREKFLWNLLPTDVDFGPDGQVYVSDWVEGWGMPNKGRLYRVFDPAQTNSAIVAEVKQLLRDGVSQRGIPGLKDLLGHPDMRVRAESQFELVERCKFQLSEMVRSRGTYQAAHETNAMFALIDTARTNNNQMARVHAIWGLGQIARLPGTIPVTTHQITTSDGQKQPRIVPFRTAEVAFSRIRVLLNDPEPEIRAQTAHVFGDAHYDSAYTNLVAMLFNPQARVRFAAAMAVSKMGRTNHLGAVLEMVRSNAGEDPFLTHAAVTALQNTGGLGPIMAAARDRSPLVRRTALLAMRRLERPEIAQFLRDSEPRLVTEAARAINDLPITNALPALASLLDQPESVLGFPDGPDGKPGLRSQILARAVNAAFRLGERPQANAIAALAARAGVPPAVRATALEALADWARPGPLDRVMRLWRPLADRSPAPAHDALRPHLESLWKDPDEKVLIAAVRAARQLGMVESATALMNLFQNKTQAPTLRVEIIGALGGLKAPTLGDAVQTALADTNPLLRREAVKWVEFVNPADSARMLGKLLATEKDMRLTQAVIAALGQIKSDGADQLLETQLDGLLSGGLRKELQLDVIEAGARRSSPSVRGKLERYNASLPAGDPLAPYRPVLAGGDAAEGKKIFNEREDVACLRCHAVKATGGTVGPDLAGIGTRQNREYLLEAIVLPNRQIAAGYENVVIALKGGRVVAGMVQKEDAGSLLINSPEDGVLTLSKTDIQSRQRTLSAMPEGLDRILTRQELRDLVEYLASLKP